MRGFAVLLCACSVVVGSAFAPMTGVAGVDGQAGSACGAEVSQGKERHTLRFVLPLCRPDGIFYGLTVSPRMRVSGVEPQFAVSGGVSGDALTSCRVTRDGRRIRCEGMVHGAATVSGAFRVRGDRCDADTLFETSGGLDCDSGEVCPEIGLILRRRVRAPAGCG